MKANTTKAKLRAGEPVFGCFVRYPNATLVEVLGYQSWDFIMFDAEHGPLDPGDCENMVRAAELRGVTPVVRATTNQPPVILRFLDTGVQGIHVPWVNSAAEAEAAVRAVKYHPHGVRGLAGVRSADYGQTISLAEYIERANEETMVIIHIETAEAVAQIDEIAAVDGVDVLFIGPTDLSHSLGVTGQLRHPEMSRALGRIAEAAGAREGRPYLGIYAGNLEMVHEWRERGAQYFGITMDAILRPAAEAFLEAARAS